MMDGARMDGEPRVLVPGSGTHESGNVEPPISTGAIDAGLPVRGRIRLPYIVPRGEIEGYWEDGSGAEGVPRGPRAPA